MTRGNFVFKDDVHAFENQSWENGTLQNHRMLIAYAVFLNSDITLLTLRKFWSGDFHECV